MQYIMSEIAVWSRLRHQNVAEFIGCRMDDSSGPAFVSRWMENGTAFQYVINHPLADVYPLVRGPWSLYQFIWCWTGVKDSWDSTGPWLPPLFGCRAFGFEIGGSLISRSVGILGLTRFQDNVFISATGDPQISCFGMSRMNGPSQRIRQTQLSSIRGSLPWMAIELFKLGEVTYTKETDIWAFGMTVYVSLSEDLAVLRIISNRLTQNWQELITRKRPYENVNNILALISTIGHGVKPSAPERLELATTDRRILWKVCNVSWSNEPADRWAMSKVVSFLSKKTAPESDIKSLSASLSNLSLHRAPSPHPARPKSSDGIPVTLPNITRPVSGRREKGTSRFRNSFQRFKGDCLLWS